MFIIHQGCSLQILGSLGRLPKFGSRPNKTYAADLHREWSTNKWISAGNSKVRRYLNEVIQAADDILSRLLWPHLRLYVMFLRRLTTTAVITSIPHNAPSTECHGKCIITVIVLLSLACVPCIPKIREKSRNLKKGHVTNLLRVICHRQAGTSDGQSAVMTNRFQAAQ